MLTLPASVDVPATEKADRLVSTPPTVVFPLAVLTVSDRPLPSMLPPSVTGALAPMIDRLLGSVRLPAVPTVIVPVPSGRPKVKELKPKLLKAVSVPCPMLRSPAAGGVALARPSAADAVGAARRKLPLPVSGPPPRLRVCIARSFAPALNAPFRLIDCAVSVTGALSVVAAKFCAPVGVVTSPPRVSGPVAVKFVALTACSEAVLLGETVKLCVPPLTAAPTVSVEPVSVTSVPSVRPP